jgi:hypothetical protein
MSPDASELPAADGITPQPVPDRAAFAGVATPTPGPEVGQKQMEEVELWWGSYSGWTMTPSFVVCLLLTGLIAWAAWYFVPQGWVQLSALGAASVVWLVQFARWGSRFFGRNYRLTTRRLFVIRGVRRLTITELDLRHLGPVTVNRSWLERQVHVGRVVVEREGGPPLVLEGVHHPQRCADLIREAGRIVTR